MASLSLRPNGQSQILRHCKVQLKPCHAMHHDAKLGSGAVAEGGLRDNGGTQTTGHKRLKLSFSSFYSETMWDTYQNSSIQLYSPQCGTYFKPWQTQAVQTTTVSLMIVSVSFLLGPFAPQWPSSTPPPLRPRHRSSRHSGVQRRRGPSPAPGSAGAARPARGPPPRRPWPTQRAA